MQPSRIAVTAKGNSAYRQRGQVDGRATIAGLKYILPPPEKAL